MCYQIRRSLLNEDEYGFRKARRPMYHDDEGLEVRVSLCRVDIPPLEVFLANIDKYWKLPLFLFWKKQKTRQTLNTKLSQLNAAIDNVSARLRGGNNTAAVPAESDSEVEATMWNMVIFNIWCFCWALVTLQPWFAVITYQSCWTILIPTLCFFFSFHGICEYISLE